MSVVETGNGRRPQRKKFYKDSQGGIALGAMTLLFPNKQLIFSFNLNFRGERSTSQSTNHLALDNNKVERALFTRQQRHFAVAMLTKIVAFTYKDYVVLQQQKG